AFAEAPGMPLDLWQAATQVTRAGDLTLTQLEQFARSSAASFLVETSQDGFPVFRLFHQALNDALLRARSRIAASADDEKALTQAFAALGRQCGWDRAAPYLLRSLPVHAARSEMIDDVLADTGYLLHADLVRLLPLVDQATTLAGRQRAR